jgi:hypothetical protein
VTVVIVLVEVRDFVVELADEDARDARSVHDGVGGKYLHFRYTSVILVRIFNESNYLRESEVKRVEDASYYRVFNPFYC